MGRLASGWGQIPIYISVRDVNSKASCSNEEFLLCSNSFKWKEPWCLLIQCSTFWLLSQLSFRSTTSVSIQSTSFPLTSPYSALSLLIATPIITTMQAPRLLDVRFKADDSDSDHHGHRTHTSVCSLLGLLRMLLTSTTASRCKHAARISKTELR